MHVVYLVGITGYRTRGDAVRGPLAAVASSLARPWSCVDWIVIAHVQDGRDRCHDGVYEAHVCGFRCGRTPGGLDVVACGRAEVRACVRRNLLMVKVPVNRSNFRSSSLVRVQLTALAVVDSVSAKEEGIGGGRGRVNLQIESKRKKEPRRAGTADRRPG